MVENMGLYRFVAKRVVCVGRGFVTGKLGTAYVGQP